MKASICAAIILGGMLLLPTDFVLAEGFVRLVGIPGVNPNSQSTEEFVTALYWLSISVAAFLAVIKIILAGAKYMFTDIVTSKGDAVKDIRASVFGLIIVLAAVLILQTINPELATLNFLRNAPKIDGNAQGSANNFVWEPRVGESLTRFACTEIMESIDETGVPRGTGRYDCANAERQCVNFTRREKSSDTVFCYRSTNCSGTGPC